MATPLLLLVWLCDSWSGIRVCFCEHPATEQGQTPIMPETCVQCDANGMKSCTSTRCHTSLAGLRLPLVICARAAAGAHAIM